MIAFPTKIDHANYRYPTDFKKGIGYFGDGYRYLVANNDKDVYEFNKYNRAGHKFERLVDGEWIAI